MSDTKYKEFIYIQGPFYQKNKLPGPYNFTIRSTWTWHCIL